MTNEFSNYIPVQDIPVVIVGINPEETMTESVEINPLTTDQTEIMSESVTVVVT